MNLKLLLQSNDDIQGTFGIWWRDADDTESCLQQAKKVLAVSAVMTDAVIDRGKQSVVDKITILYSSVKEHSVFEEPCTSRQIHYVNLTTDTGHQSLLMPL
jgi:hypothetical protein